MKSKNDRAIGEINISKISIFRDRNGFDCARTIGVSTFDDDENIA